MTNVILDVSYEHWGARPTYRSEGSGHEVRLVKVLPNGSM